MLMYKKELPMLPVLLMALVCWGCSAGTKQEPEKPEAVAGQASLSEWIGSYASVSGRCGELSVRESNITWGGCKEAATRLVSVSPSELVMQIDSEAAQCGWAGFIVALEKGDDGKAPREISISAYTGPEDYKNTNRFVQCSYLAKER